VAFAAPSSVVMTETAQARTAPTTSRDEAHTIAVEAYIYLYPLVTMEVTRRQLINVPLGARPGGGPVNTFSHFREFPRAEFRAVVRPNFDTLYSTTSLDLTREPMVVSVPDTGGRYYLLPMCDMWTDVFAAPGSRTTGTQAGHFAVLPPGWTGALPDGVEPIPAPTPYVWVIGRTQTNGPRDYAAVHAVQDGFSITPLSFFGSEPPVVEVRIDQSVDMTTPTLEQVNTMPAADYFTLAADLLCLHPPHVTDWSILARLRRVGIVAGEPLALASLPAVLREGLDAAPAAGLGLMRRKAGALAPTVNGWQFATDAFGVYGTDYLKRAVVSMVGLGANPPEDALYPLLKADADGRPLDGGSDYLLHFDADELPPVDAFWSVTMYDSDGFQAPNAMDRFAIGDRDDLAYNSDGSLDLYLQHESPGPQKESNWLPAPRGPLGVTMRLYAPRPEALDGRWAPPAVRRV
jgi:hypothetical protein